MVWCRLCVWDFAEAFEVVVGVVPHFGVGVGAASYYESAFAAMVQAGGFDGVFAVVTGAFLGEEAFVISEVFAVVVAVVGFCVGVDVFDLLERFVGEGVDWAGGDAVDCAGRGLGGVALVCLIVGGGGAGPSCCTGCCAGFGGCSTGATGGAGAGRGGVCCGWGVVVGGAEQRYEYGNEHAG